MGKEGLNKAFVCVEELASTNRKKIQEFYVYQRKTHYKSGPWMNVSATIVVGLFLISVFSGLRCLIPAPIPV